MDAIAEIARTQARLDAQAKRLAERQAKLDALKAEAAATLLASAGLRSGQIVHYGDRRCFLLGATVEAGALVLVIQPIAGTFTMTVPASEIRP